MRRPHISPLLLIALIAVLALGAVGPRTTAVSLAQEACDGIEVIPDPRPRSESSPEAGTSPEARGGVPETTAENLFNRAEPRAKFDLPGLDGVAEEFFLSTAEFCLAPDGFVHNEEFEGAIQIQVLEGSLELTIQVADLATQRLADGSYEDITAPDTYTLAEGESVRLINPRFDVDNETADRAVFTVASLGIAEGGCPRACILP